MIGDIDNPVFEAFGAFGVRPYMNQGGKLSVQVSRGAGSVLYNYLTPEEARAMADGLVQAAKEVERLYHRKGDGRDA